MKLLLGVEAFVAFQLALPGGWWQSSSDVTER
jgi:hypothetical protein